MKAIYIVLVLLIITLISGCVNNKDQNISTIPPTEVPPAKEDTVGNGLPENYVSEVESNLTQIESMLNENEESYSTEVKDSVFD